MIEFVNSFGPRWWYEEENWTLRPNGYYFHTEDDFSCCGPYETKEECQTALAKYAQSLEPE